MHTWLRARSLGPIGAALLLARASSTQITDWEVVTAIEGPDTDLTRGLEAFCPGGKQLLGGGTEVSGAIEDTAFYSSYPEGTPGAPDQWFALATDDGVGSWSLRVDAICGVVPGYAVVSDALASAVGTLRSWDVGCPAGTEPLGGGVSVGGGGDGIRVVASNPTPPGGGGGDGGRWVATVTDDGVTPWSLTVFALCGVVPGYELVSDGSGTGVATQRARSVACPESKERIGGGAHIGGAFGGAQLTASLPSESNGWSAAASDDGVGNWSLGVHVICPEPAVVSTAIASSAALAGLGWSRRRPGGSRPRDHARTPRSMR